MPLDSDSELVALQAACRGRFAVERELGRGGMGVVVLARDLLLGRPVAIKVLPLTLARQPSLRDRFLREARTAAGLSHPNIVPIHSVEEHDDVVFFVMGFVEGETLAQRVARQGPLGPVDATRLIQEVAWALAYAHGRGIVHRDVKPDNILVERATGRALVTDFGIARVADATRALTLDGHVMGTAQFMSPEQAAGEPVDGRSDLYALGVVGFLALTGTMPFEAESLTALLAMQVTRPAPSVSSRRPGLPIRLAAAVDRCMAKDPADRFPSGEALAEELSAVDLPTTVSVPPQVRNFQRIAEQSTMMLWFVVVLSLASLQAVASPRWWAAFAGPIGAVIGVVLDLGRRARQLLADGFDAGDVVRAFILERDARDAEVAAMYRGTERLERMRVVRRRALLIAGGSLLAMVALIWARHAVVGPAAVALRVAAVVALIVSGLAAIVGLNSTEAAERRAGALAGRLWRSGFTIYFFRLAGIGLRPEQRVASHAPTPYVPVPDAVRRLLPALPRMLDRVDDVLGVLREREGQIEAALAEAGPAPAAEPTDGMEPGPGITTRAILLHRRVALVGELHTALDTVRAQRGNVIAAQENVRLQLTRARAGLTAPEDLTPDVDTLRSVLDAAERGA